jgi:hypothetical protein|tara:strand:- start:321 stop:761 length:441 start_codon:yes stop_codon:yes gene_type:complete
MVDRKNRDTEVRDTKTRTETNRYTDPNVLPQPNPRPGLTHKYVRFEILGQRDERNMMAHMQQGWKVCQVEDYPEIPIYGKDKGNYEIGGLMLMKQSTEYKKSRDEFHANKTSQQSAAVDNNLMRQNDPRMPMFSERKSTTTRGRQG